jgi:hypothetical protein
MRANQTVRAKAALVNSVFLVQLRKNLPADFLSSIPIKQRLSETLLVRKTTAHSLQTHARRRNL